MKILDSHEFIELYRGSKDLKLGYLLCERYGDEYIFLCPKVNSYADEKLFGQKYFNLENVKNILGHIPDKMSFYLYDCIRLYKKLVYFKKVESTNFFQLPMSYLPKIRKLKPDVIIESNYTTLTPRSYLNYIASKLFNIPILWIDCGDGGKIMFLKGIEKIVANNVSRIITYSYGGKQRLIDKYNISSDKIIVKPKPVDMERFSNCYITHKAYKKDFCIGYVGGLAENKGFNSFIEIAKNYLSNSNLKFMAIGDFTSEFEREKYMPQIPDKVVLTGYVDHKNIPYYMSKIDLLVIPNMTNPPAFTTVLAEALASGVPCVIGIKGYEEYIPVNDKNACFIVNPNDVGEIINIIDYLLSKPYEEYGKLKKLTREFAEKELSWDAQLSFYREILEDILRNKKANF